MPRTIPRYRLHTSSGQAVVSIDGTDVYLGKHDSPASRVKYAELVSAYIDRKPKLDNPCVARRLTVATAVDRFWFAHVSTLDRRDRHHYQRAFLPLVEKHGRKPLADFGPNAFREVRKAYVALGWSRQHANFQADRLKRFLRWLVSHELFDVAKLAAIREVPRLKKGEAVESKGVKPVSWELVEACLPSLPDPVRRLVLFLWWTGARPSEACVMEQAGLNRTGRLVTASGDVLMLPGVLVYALEQHKTAGSGKVRRILIGPRAQAVIGTSEILFDPRTVAKNPHVRSHYRPHSITTAVRRACAEGCHWHPYQVRHSAATRFRAHGGLEVARTLLGHSGASITEHYAREDWMRAAATIREIG